MKKVLLYLFGLGFVLAGLNHFWSPWFYEKLLGGLLPYASELNYLSGAAEILGGVGLLIPPSRKFSAWGLVILLVAIFPANVNMALHPERWNLYPVVLYLRLPLQLVLIWWAYQYTKK